MQNYRKLAGQIVSGQQPILENCICDFLDKDINDVTVGEILNWLEDNDEYTGPFTVKEVR